MITIKLSADNLRMIRAAKSEPELRGVVDLVIERIDQAEAMKVFGKETRATVKAKKRYNWKIAKDVMGRVLGDQLKAPPFPDPIWYQRVHRSMMLYDLTEEKLTKLAEYCRDNLNPPYSLDFLVGQYERILAGNYDRGKRRGVSSDATFVTSNWRKNTVLPED